MNNIKGFQKLTNSQQELFVNTYKKHVATMGNSSKRIYSIENIKQVKWDKRECYLKIYFNNDEWYHYYSNGTWG